jgi:hypothetical protein
MKSAGLLSLMLLDRDSEPIAENVWRIDGLDDVMPDRTPASLLSTCMFVTLPIDERERVKRTVRAMAFSPDADQSAVELHNLLKGVR